MTVPTLSLDLHDEENLLFKGIRIIYPNLWEPGTYEGDSTGYDALLLLPKDNTEAVKMLQWYLTEVAKVNDINIAQAQICARDADKAGKTEPPEAGHLMIRVRSKLYPPRVFDANMVEHSQESDEICYSGSYCNVLTRGYGRPKKGKLKAHIGLNPLAFQHVADGERVGGGSISDDGVASAFGAAPKKPDLTNTKTAAPEGFGAIKRNPQDDFDDDIPF